MRGRRRGRQSMRARSPAAAAAISSMLSATRASPFAYRAMPASARRSTVDVAAAPRPALWVARARAGGCVTIASRPSGCSTKTFERESSAAFTSNEGFSVVAPIRTMSPDSTRGRKASCCALLKRWISSMKRIVRRPERRRASSASAITSRISLMPDSTALNVMKCARVTFAITRASVVLPVPGGPQRMIDCSRSLLDRFAKRAAGRRGALPGRRTRRACAGASVRRAAPTGPQAEALPVGVPRRRRDPSVRLLALA